ncbi:diamine N-acetyltransferase [Patescibacteria group bacterium]|nr:diamine N-acetyltransferase [Patescibacteria group bacterium]
MLNNNIKQTARLNLRPMLSSDKVFVEALYHASRDDLRLIDAEEDFVETLIEIQQQAQTIGYGELFPNAMYFIVERQGERIGRIVIDFGMNEVRLVDMVFIPLARGKGYGSEVIQMLQHAATVNQVPLILSVVWHNQVAKALYLKLGFLVQSSTGMYETLIWYPNQPTIIR